MNEALSDELDIFWCVNFERLVPSNSNWNVCP